MNIKVNLHVALKKPVNVSFFMGYYSLRKTF